MVGRINSGMDQIAIFYYHYLLFPLSWAIEMIPPVNFHVQNMQYAQLVKNLSAMQETWVQSLGWEDPLEKGKATHSSNSGLENSMECIVHGVTKGQTWLNNFHFTSLCPVWLISSNQKKTL